MPTFFYCYFLGYNRPLKFKELKMEKYNKLRIEWDCRRGMLELDKIIMPFYLKHFDELTDDKKDIFIRLLASTDLQLFSWFFNHQIQKFNLWWNISKTYKKSQLIKIIKIRMNFFHTLVSEIATRACCLEY